MQDVHVPLIALVTSTKGMPNLHLTFFGPQSTLVDVNFVVPLREYGTRKIREEKALGI